MKPGVETYVAIFKKGHDRPVAFFLDPQDAAEWHANPELYSNARRRLDFSQQPPAVLGEAQHPAPVPAGLATAALEVLRRIIFGADKPMCEGIEAGKEMLQRLGMAPYAIGADGKSITCHTCGRTSHHLKDVENLYCGFCHKFLGE